jgi:hypothetical protein
MLPILQAAQPSSCAECHLSGVDLKQYIHEDQQRTFASLRESGLIDLQNPDNSKILQFIARKPDKPSIVREQARNEEYAAFRSWIRAAVQDPTLRAARLAGEALGPGVPVEVIRHARSDRVLQSFIDNVWSEIGRCAACHSPDRNQKQVQEHGEQVSWIKLNDPQATLAHMLEYELIDLDEPAQSLLLKKPTLQVEHGGGQKLLIGDRTYRQFLQFITDYAATRAGRYSSARDLPEPADEVSQVSEIWFKVEDVPPRFDKMLLRVDIYRWHEDAQRWSERPWATGDRGVFGKGRLWQQHLTRLAPRGSARAEEIRRQPRLPRGKYLAKVYVDTEKKLETSPGYVLGDAELVGQVEFTTHWPPGYGSMTVVKFPQ